MKLIKRIAILDLYYGKSGKLGFYNSQAVGLAKAYTKLGYEVLIARPEKEIENIVEQELQQGIILLSIPAKVLGVHSFYPLDFLLQYKVDLVHLNSDNQAYAPAVIKFCKKHQIPQYNYVGTLYSDSENQMKQFLMNFFSVRNIRYYKKSNTFVKTEQVLQVMKKKGIQNAKVVPVGLDFEVVPEIKETKEECRQFLDLPLDKKILLYVGRLAEYKKPLDALDVLAGMPENYVLAVIGTGELKEAFFEKVEKLNLSSRLKYIEAIPNVEIHKYYKAADCFINFNPQEIFGMSILEAAYQSCPVVARHAAGPDTIVSDGKTGFLCGHVQEMIEKIPKVTSQMGEAGRKRVQEQFSWEAASKKFLEDFT